MKEIIKKLCEQLEKEHNIKIIFAIESGSRVWGMHSEDSDYDIRFVYQKPMMDYITLAKGADVITTSFDKKGNRVPVKGCDIDFQGFDIHKYLGMLLKSNPTCIEWLKSDIVYYGEQPKEWQKWVQNNFKPIALYYHYISMGKQNYIKYIKSGNLVTYKKYLYAMREIVNAQWVLEFKNIPPILFTDTLAKMEKFIPSNIMEKLRKIIELKKSGKEKDIIENEVGIDDYIESFLKRDVLILKVLEDIELKDINKDLLEKELKERVSQF